MKTPPTKSRRQTIRLKNYDYSQNGAYFITICVKNRECLFGDIIDGEMVLNEAGGIVCEEWENSSSVRPEIALDAFIIMPNHIHGIVVINDIGVCDDAVGAHGCAPLQQMMEKHGHKIVQDDIKISVGAHSRAPGKMLFRPQRSLGSFIAGFKSICTTRVNVLRRTPYNPLWQRNYYEHIIRHENDLNQIRQYIQNNPANWGRDELFK